MTSRNNLNSSKHQHAKLYLTLHEIRWCWSLRSMLCWIKSAKCHSSNCDSLLEAPLICWRGCWLRRTLSADGGVTSTAATAAGTTSSNHPLKLCRLLIGNPRKFLTSFLSGSAVRLSLPQVVVSWLVSVLRTGVLGDPWCVCDEGWHLDLGSFFELVQQWWPFGMEPWMTFAQSETLASWRHCSSCHSALLTLASAEAAAGCLGFSPGVTVRWSFKTLPPWDCRVMTDPTVS